jgi:ATP-dependent protease ClpP protease subunit
MSKNKRPFQLQMKRTAKTVRITMSGYIERWNKNSAEEVGKLLNQVKDGDKLEVMIRNLYGGSVMEGLLIYHDLKALKPLMLLDGVAASMGSIIFQAGAKRRMSKHSKQMLHRVNAGASGDPDQIATELKQIRAWEKELCGILMERTGLDEAGVRSKFMVTGKDCWLDAKACLKAKLADDVVEGSLRRNVEVDETEEEELDPQDILARFEAAMAEPDEDEEEDEDGDDSDEDDDTDSDTDEDTDEDESDADDDDDTDEDDEEEEAPAPATSKSSPLSIMNLFGKKSKALEALAKKPAAKLTAELLNAADAELKAEKLEVFVMPVTAEAKNAGELTAHLETITAENTALKAKAEKRKERIAELKEQVATLTNKTLKGSGEANSPKTKKDTPAPTGKKAKADPEAMVHDPKNPINAMADRMGLGPKAAEETEEEENEEEETDETEA